MSTKYATSGTTTSMIALLNKFYYSTSFTFNEQTGEVFNSRGLVNGVEVIYKKGRYIFQSKQN